MTDTEYLEQKLKWAELELKEVKINHRINIAVYESKKEILQKEIESIRSQLNKK